MRDALVIIAPVMLLIGCSFSAPRVSTDGGGEGPDGRPLGDGTMPADGPVAVTCAGNNLVLCLPFEGSLADGASSMNLVSGIPVAYETGHAGMAARLSTAVAITVAESDTVDPPEITMEAWVRPDSGGAGYILDNENQFSLRVSGTSAACLVVGQTSAFPQATGGSVPASTWTHIACTYSAAAGLHLYVNGNQVGSDTADGALRDLGTIGTAIGRNNPTGTNYQGLIDELRIWSVARPAAEICPGC